MVVKVGQTQDYTLIPSGTDAIVNLPPPQTSGAPARLIDLNNAVAGFQPKESVQAMATANVTVSNPGTATFDGVTLVAGQRLLLTGQTTTSQNGVWVFNGSGVALTRPSDFANGEVLALAPYVVIGGGTVHDNQAWILSGQGPWTVDTTAQTWVEFATGLLYSGGNGITVSGSGVIALATLNGKAAGTITGNGATSSFTLTHSLGTTDVLVQVFDSSGNFIIVGVQATNSTTVTITFAAPVANGTTYRVVVIA